MERGRKKKWDRNKDVIRKREKNDKRAREKMGDSERKKEIINYKKNDTKMPFKNKVKFFSRELRLI